MQQDSSTATDLASEVDRVEQPSMFDVEHEVLQETIARAQRTVAQHSLNADDCRELLRALGIDKLHTTVADFDWRDNMG